MDNNNRAVVLVIGVIVLACILGLPEAMQNYRNNTATITPDISVPTEFQQAFWESQWGQGEASRYQLCEDGSAKIVADNGEITGGCLVPEWGCEEYKQGELSEFQSYAQAILASSDPNRSVELSDSGIAIVKASQTMWVGCLIPAYGCENK